MARLTAVRARVSAARHRLPEPWAGFVERAKWLPRPGAEPPGPAPAPAPGTRVLIAPANFAGQGWQWARALERSGVPAEAWEWAATGGFGYAADHRDTMAVNRAPAGWHRGVFDAVVATVDAVVLEAGRPVFGRLFGFDPVREARALRAAGVRVATLWHGSDIRLPSAHAAAHPGSPFADPGLASWTAVLEAVARRNRSRLERIGGSALVSTPDLLADLPGAAWCPVVVDPAAWRGGGPVLERAVPVVLHVPSNPVVKGTELVEPVLRRLADEGLIEYRTARGLDAGRMRTAVADADVVADQFRLGIYGVAAVEAMAAGRLVVSMVHDQVRAEVRTVTGRELPVLEAPPERLEHVLRGVLEHRAAARRLAAEGPGFVAEVHDGRRSAEVLGAVLGLR